MNIFPKILLAEDQQLIREGLVQILKTNFYILSAVSNGIEILEFLKKNEEHPDLCLIDIQMPELDGIECSRIIRESYPQIKIALLTSFNSLNHLEQGFLANVNGYILKDSSIDGFHLAIHSILSGQFVAPQPLIQKLSNRYNQLVEVEKKHNFPDAMDLLPLSELLDEKEIEIIKLIWSGWTNRMIADDLYISEGTVKNYVSRIYKKLKINSRSELINYLGTRKE
jgi:DNA-binding NarL/FixJ family response regulator